MEIGSMIIKYLLLFLGRPSPSPKEVSLGMSQLEENQLLTAS